MEMSCFMELTCLVEVLRLNYEIPHLMEMPQVEKNVSTNEFSKLQMKYHIVPRVDTLVRMKL